jgi:hypothetical protein
MDERAGRIRAVEVHFDPRAEFVRRTYAEFFRALPEDVAVWVAVEKAEDYEAFAALTGRQGTPVVIGKPITTWARDRFVTGAAGAIVIPPEPHRGPVERANDALVPPALAAALGVPTRKAPFRFDGGDFCRAYGRVFASSFWAERNPERSLDDLLRLAEGLFSEPIVYLPNAPRHHVGMAFAPVGGKRFLVGDSRWGARIAPAGVTADASEETARRFDGIADALKAAGFEVTRVPVIPTTDDYAWMTWTNAVFEERVAYVPTYGAPEADAVALGVYREMGYEVRGVDVSEVWRRGGTLHCLVHVLGRE